MIRIARPKLRTLGIVALPVLAVAVTVPTVAMAVDPAPANVFKGCLTDDGDLFNVALNPSSGPDCSASLFNPGGTLITWNQAGVKGDQGNPGAASTVAGPVGKSAYQIAVDNGFAGTVTEWLASLKGATGAAGTAASGSVTGYKMVKAATKAKARTAATYTVFCKDGRVAIGGGLNSATADLILNNSGPTPDGKGWIVRATNVATKNRAIAVYVTCAFATP